MIKLNSDALIVLTSYFSFGWTQNCICSLRRHIKNCDILVIDNNPSIFDEERRKISYQSYCITSTGEPVQNNFESCEIERKKLSKFQDLKVLQTPWRSSHGDCIDMAMKYAHQNYYRYLVHVEPDCLIKGRIWFDNLLGAVENGAHMASGCKFATGHLHPTPSIWNVKETKNLSFNMRLIKATNEDSDFSRLYKLDSPTGVVFKQPHIANFFRTYFDTGVYAWYVCAKKDRAQHIHAPDLKHIWAKSSSKYTGFFF